MGLRDASASKNMENVWPHPHFTRKNVIDFYEWKCLSSPPVWLKWEILVGPAKLVGILVYWTIWNYIYSILNITWYKKCFPKWRPCLKQFCQKEPTSSVSGSFAPRVSGRKEVAMEPARQISIMIRYGIWIEGSWSCISCIIYLSYMYHRSWSCKGSKMKDHDHVYGIWNMGVLRGSCIVFVTLIVSSIRCSLRCAQLDQFAKLLHPVGSTHQNVDGSSCHGVGSSNVNRLSKDQITWSSPF